MMPSMAAMPNSATKPIAADTLNGVPVRNSAKMPPISAIGITLAASSVSTSEPKLMNSRMQISSRLSGTTIARRCRASCRLAEFADPFQPIAGRQRHLLGDLAAGPPAPRCPDRARAR